MVPRQQRYTLFPYTTLFRSRVPVPDTIEAGRSPRTAILAAALEQDPAMIVIVVQKNHSRIYFTERSEEHTSELQSQFHLVCRLLLEKKKRKKKKKYLH